MNRLSFSHWKLFGIWDLGFGNSRRSRAFTLIELLIVISIIGILLSVSVVGWMSVSARGRDSTRKSDLARIKQALLQEYSDTRLYPAFDNSQGLIYGASWQLTSDGLSCVHPAGTRLTPRYLADIPHDPLDGTNYAQSCGTGLTEGQSNRYIYMSAPTDPSSGPAANATGFALLATLEQGTNDRITDPKLNPLDTQYNGTTFGSWYSLKHNYDSPLSINANYLVTNTNQ